MFDKLQNDLKTAQLERDEVKVSTLRILLSEVHNTKIQKGMDLTDQDISSVIRREVKKRKEAAEGFKSGGRNEQAEKEETEAKILESYLPAQLTNEELTDIVERAINEIGATGVSDMGKVIGVVMGKVAGRADGERVSMVVKEKLIG